MKSLKFLMCLLLLSSCVGIKTARIVDGPAGMEIAHSGFLLSYNIYNKTPNWVAWELSAIETEGIEARAKHFYPDPDLILPQADNDDYRNSGWDKGHMAPAADMKWSEQSMKECFYLTNICPQNHNLNAGDWKDLEEKSRDLAKRFGKVDIICGPIFLSRSFGQIGENQVSVPDAFYKVLLLKADGEYHGIGFYFENKAGHKPLMSYSLTIDDVEELTGIDFYYQLRDGIENRVESELDTTFWSQMLN